ncbi:hypothetical protein HYDPIDRAFT_111306 [Hydnomerulius pinastri MD-312]|uniref:F-box domain-containing protein n=1 Tax=Hydnomerulius pinastri MD-312 TaxID=994086 RepID=A0A0C9W1H1_9AGAM|nr:hypothetical protein HYDPIDRAFT_111306 [Hydnomerulius pinastri MD-312]
MRKFHPTFAPLLLTLVCRKWRAVAHATPRLWHRVLVLWHCAFTSRVTFQSFLTALDQWFQRSQDLTLTVRIDCESDYYPSGSESESSDGGLSEDSNPGYARMTSAEFLSVIHRHTARFRIVSVNAGLARKLFPSKLPVPSLTRLVLMPTDGPEVPNIGSFDGIAGIRHLVLDDWEPSFFHEHRLLQGLRILDLGTAPAADMMANILQLWTSLTTLRVSGAGFLSPPQSKLGVVRHEALASLAWLFYSHSPPSFTSFELPALRSVTVGLATRTTTIDLSGFFAMLSRSSCTLDKFKVRSSTKGFSLPEAQVQELLTVAKVVHVNDQTFTRP